MDAGLAAIIGGAIGTGGTWVTTFLNAHFNRKPKDEGELFASNLLTKALNNPGLKWRSINALSNIIGTDEPTTRRLLLGIGARGSERDGNLWGLVSRNPLGEHLLPGDPSGQDTADRLIAEWAKEDFTSP